MAAPEEFWNWFIEHESNLFDFELHKERIFDELAAELQKLDPDLTFEFGSNDGSTREFVVSAGGIRRAFPAVTSLVAAAPTLPRWKVTAFRPRRPPSAVELGDVRVDPEDVWFTLLDNGNNVGLYLFIPGLQEERLDLRQIGYLLLDTTLGEYDVETRLGLIKMLSPETRTRGDRYPLTQLPALFDGLISRLEGRSKKTT
jgi:hypothetical protein